MRRVLFISLAVTLTIGLAATGILYAHGFGYYGDEDVKTEVKKIDKGIQITLVSDDPDVAKDIQENLRWYRDVFKYGEHRCPYAQGGKMGYRHGCMW